MKLFVGSIAKRLFVMALLWVTVWIASGAYIFSHEFRRYVTEQFVEELRGHADELVGLLTVGPNGQLDLSSPLTDPLFLGDEGYYWEVMGTGGPLLRSPSLHKSDLHFLADTLTDRDYVILDGASDGGKTLILAKVFKLANYPDKVIVVIGGDRKNLDRKIHAFNSRLGFWLGVIALGIIGTSILLFIMTIYPVKRIRDALVQIREGQLRQLPDDLPPEIYPLAADMNHLLGTNEALVTRARAQAGGLAHSLKTPLALIMDEGVRLTRQGQQASGQSIIENCNVIRRQIDYHIAQARAAAVRTSTNLSVRVRPVIEYLVSGISSLQSDRDLDFEALGDLDARVQCDRKDLENVLGNAIDNAAKWARSTVRIEVQQNARERNVLIAVDDDGPGIPEQQRLQVFEIGVRLDEEVPGSGLGLAIVRDVVDLYGGKVWIDQSTLGGCRLCIQLPQAA